MSEDLKNSIAFLKENTGKASSFKAPEGYFDAFEERLFAREEIPNTAKNKGFKIPENYFNDAEERIFEATISREPQHRKTSYYRHVVQMIPTAVAASLLLFMAYTYFAIVEPNNLSSFSTEEIEDWYDYGYLDNNDSEFALVIDEASLTFDSDILNTVSLEDEDVEAYLNNLSSETLANEIE